MKTQGKKTRRVFGRLECADADGQVWKFELTKIGLTVRRKRARKSKAKTFTLPDLAELSKFTHSQAVAQAKAAAAAAAKADVRQLEMLEELPEPERQMALI